MMLLDLILVVFFIFFITWILHVLSEMPLLESSLFGSIALFLVLAKFKTVEFIHYSPLLSLLYSAVIFSIAGVALIAIFIKIARYGGI